LRAFLGRLCVTRLPNKNREESVIRISMKMRMSRAQPNFAFNSNFCSCENWRNYIYRTIPSTAALSRRLWEAALKYIPRLSSTRVQLVIPEPSYSIIAIRSVYLQLRFLHSGMTGWDLDPRAAGHNTFQLSYHICPVYVSDSWVPIL